MVMSEIMSLHLVVVSGWVHRSRVFVASSHMGMGSIGIIKISASGPLFLCRHSRYAVTIFRHCSGESGAHVMVLCCRFSNMAEMMLGGLLSLV